jgi:DNA-directed RNA polymerase omega subunit
MPKGIDNYTQKRYNNILDGTYMKITKLTLSRGTGINTEKCTENAGGSRFDLVLIASERAREIKRQHRDNPNASFGQVHTIVSALEEIQEGKVDPITYLKKVR